MTSDDSQMFGGMILKWELLLPIESMYGIFAYI